MALRLAAWDEVVGRGMGMGMGMEWGKVILTFQHGLLPHATNVAPPHQSPPSRNMASPAGDITLTPMELKQRESHPWKVLSYSEG